MTLADSEIEYIEGILGREMNELEEGMLDVMFSEHCSYKSSRPFLRAFPTEGKNIILGPGDDAGLVSVTDKYALAVGMESHNHPSAIEPYGGAGTGIGGILRDIISMGAMPIALLDSLRFGPLEDEKSRYLFEHVVEGISDYGNRVGVPTVAGEIEFDESFRTNPLVNVMCVGLVEKENIVRAQAPNYGDVFLLMGGTTGRDGIHGVTFASEELTSDSETEDRPAVQVADPFTKKRVLEASLEILEKIDVSGVKDLGGGGLTCCISELVDASENGAFVDLRSIPLRETGMTPYEIMLSESQERMVFVINPKDVELAQKICDKHEIVSAVIGEVREGNNMIISDEGEEIANLPTILLADPPSIDRPLKEIPEDLEPVKVTHPPVKESLLKLLSSPNIFFLVSATFFCSSSISFIFFLDLLLFSSVILLNSSGLYPLLANSSIISRCLNNPVNCISTASYISKTAFFKELGTLCVLTPLMVLTISIIALSKSTISFPTFIVLFPFFTIISTPETAAANSRENSSISEYSRLFTADFKSDIKVFKFADEKSCTLKFLNPILLFAVSLYRILLLFLFFTILNFRHSFY